MRKDVIDNLPGFLTVAERPAAGSDGQPTFSDTVSPLRRYHVNLLVDSAEQTGAPVVYESNPTYLNLTGRVEQMAHMGTLVTDFTLIKPGALHRANGGYLILDAAKVLMAGLAWDGLKRALQFGEIRLETPGQMMSLSSTVSLEPEPIPLDVKVVLLGDPSLNYLLSQGDPDFDELFKVLADFDNVVVRAGETELAYAQLIASIVARERLRPLDSGAVARVVDEMARLVDDNERLSTHMQSLVDLLMEADHFAGELANGAPPAVVDRAAVERAIGSRFFRQNRIAERLREQMLRQTVKIDTDGSRIGRINGLSVLQMGGFAFGQPSCISATVRLGNGNVVAIDREVKLSGAIHDKGVLILSSFLQARYSLQRPLAFAASLVFEQNYGGVDGDSATSTELYALLSAIAEVPLRQSLAVTGSMNQHGEVQAIGGVNEKIEGFFDLCHARGLTGEQGVLIPAANVPHLMVRPDVAAAIAAGTFHIYPIQHVDEGIELLTGLPAGELDGRGRYPAGSVNYLVHARLTALARKRAALDRQMGGRREKGTEEEAKK
jgi:predicted ATP-dependent protease